MKETHLSSVSNSLRNYGFMVIRLVPSTVDLRVYGILCSLDDAPYVLDVLAQTVPIAIPAPESITPHHAANA
ncbi:hypothetical protein V2I52_10280 [Brenneria sp. g21c3]|uniref:hypothetical protein n=1 Tax=Brenneria sp. g21c3 TaxID=3093893 RepID=UPI002EA72EA8|nr:hypothetical protein [Brenneria sp. g21c3]